jgi:hypothetical protein
VSWDQRFAEPIVLDDGSQLTRGYRSPRQDHPQVRERYPFTLRIAAKRRHTHGGLRRRLRGLKSYGMNRIGRRVIMCMLLIAAFAIIWNLLGRG